MFTSADLLDENGTSHQSLRRICTEVIPAFPSGTVELVVLHPLLGQQFEWTDIPAGVKDHAEMRFHGPMDDKLYDTYGVDAHVGAAVVVRPDGYVGAASSLADASSVYDYLRGCLVTVT